MTKILLCLSLFVLMVYSCESKKITYEDATKWYSSCTTHPKYHPGDWLAAINLWSNNFEEWLFTGYKEGYWEVYAGIDESLCFDECHSRFNCKYEETFHRDYESNREDYKQKYFKGIK